MSVDHLDYYLNDGIHFNQEGQKAEANLIVKKIVEILNLELPK